MRILSDALRVCVVHESIWFIFLYISDATYFSAQVGTPICVPVKDFIDIGKIASIENNHKPVDIAKKGQMVAIKVCV